MNAPHAHAVASQIDTYCALGYPALAGLTEQAFRELSAPLVDRARL
ncbi:hypothetical protein LGT39_08390 [Demequina sp. TTPB684]|nr:MULTISPECIES: hypothetical protein [unclassified Demequina]MCB2412863.1 hypothetical protein [Demequina sp. TTPB684]UPU88160.1 hypothetical protein LGT36_013070 [Demequina sp. TMPB413]